MKKLTIANALAAVALAVAVPFTFAQTGRYGPGMTGGYDMGPGMMSSYGVGPGMMYGYGGDMASALDLTDDQRDKITKIHEGLSTRHWDLMGQMQAQQFRLRELVASGKADDASIGKTYKSIEDLRHQMWTTRADAQKQVDAVLTKSQREQLQRGWDRGTALPGF